MSAMSNLSHLPHDVLVVIAKQLKKLEDFVAFRCVSKSLHAAAKDEYFEGVRVRQQIPYLLLPVRDDGSDDVRELYSLVEGESVVASIKAPKLKTKKCFESLGWLLAVEEDGSMSLLDPFSGNEILLPHQHNIPRYETHHIMDEHVFIQKMVLSSRPSETLDFVLMVICGTMGHLAFWRLGDETWNVIEERTGRFIDVIHNGGEQFYATSFPGVVWAYNLAGNNNHVEAHIITRCEPVMPDMWEPHFPDYPSRNLYIVKAIDDTLLIISRMAPFLSEDGSSYITNEFHVYEVDVAMRSYKEIHSLGSMAVFVGHNSTIALDASKLPGGVIKANHIYFTDDDFEYYYFHRSAKGGGQNMGVYNMETRTVEPFYPGEPLCSKVSTSVWITPCLRNLYVTAASSEEDINGPDCMSATQMSNLSHLPHDMLVVIAKHLKKLEDFVSFRCVSKSLCAAAKDEYFEGLCCRKRTPYLMLPVRDDGNDDVRELYSLVEGESNVAYVKLPKLKTRKCFESLGWLLVVEEDGNMFLLDPFSGTEIPLPHQKTYPGYDWEGMAEYVFIQKMVLSARPSETSDFILMVIAGGLGHLAFWRLGDKAWTKIETRKGRYLDVVYDDGGELFYAIGFPGIVWAFNLAEFGNNEEEGRVITCCKSIVPGYQSCNLYILKTTDDTLLMIARGAPDLSEDGLCYMTTEFEVYEVDITTGKWKEIKSLGSMAVFIGENSTIAVDASTFPGGVIKPNHIYFTDDDWEYYYFYSKKGGGMDIGVYNLETETVESIRPGDPLFSRVSPSIWITPC